MKVAAYCRVSTDSKDQANSFENQQQYFREYIGRQPDWELYEIYADEGITGTSTKKRLAFNHMIADAKLGRFDRIITKEVSRFARNTVDALQYTRELKALGIGVLFMNDGIDTMEPDAELRLSIMGSIAQEESRKTSSRVKWGQMRRMEQGVVFGRSLLGYDVKNGNMSVNPEGAEIVRLIFHKYIHERKGTVTIAKELREAGYKTLTGSIMWRNTVILKILRNEKYCGDLCQKKTITPDYLTHQKKYNHGEEEMVYLRNHHEPIVSRELWEKAQQEIARRDLDGTCKTGHGSRYPLSGKIKCSACGKSFVSRSRKRRDGSKYRTWRCATTAELGKRHVDTAGNEVGCDVGYQIRDDVGMEIVRQSVKMLKLDREAVVRNITRIVTNVIQAEQANNQNSVENLKKQLEQTEEKRKKVLDSFFAESISKKDLKLMNAEYDKKIAELTVQITVAEKKMHFHYEISDREKEVQQTIRNIVYCKTANNEANTNIFYSNLLEQITVFPDKRMEVSLKLLPTKWLYVMRTLREFRKDGMDKIPNHKMESAATDNNTTPVP